MMPEMWNAPPGFRPTKSAPSSPAKPLGISRTRSEFFHVTHKVPTGDTPYVRAKNVQLVDKDPEKAIPLFWAAINAGDRVDSALKDMAIVMKQQNRAEEAIQAIKSLRNRCSDQAQESLDNILLDLFKRCGRLNDQIGLLRHKLYLIQQGMAFNGKRTKTARSQGKKFQVSVGQEATRLLGNLGWALMQQNNYIEAEDAYRRALLISTDNNKMCNLGICLMKQGRVGEAKETLGRVKPAVLDGPRGVDSHLKAYERAQQMLRDLKSDMMNKGGDRVEQSKLFDAFLGSSAIWQPQPCKEQTVHSTTNSFKTQDEFDEENISSNIVANSGILPAQKSVKPVVSHGNSLNLGTKIDENISSATNSFKTSDEFGDENISSNIIAKSGILPAQKGVKPMVSHGNSLNIGAKPFFYSSKFEREPRGNEFPENLKRTRSGNAASSMIVVDMGDSRKPFTIEPENKSRKQSISPEKTRDKWIELLPNSKDFEEAIIAAVLGSSNDTGKLVETSNDPGIFQRKIDKRLKVFQDITLSLSPRA